jgi:hypothetical protein
MIQVGFSGVLTEADIVGLVADLLALSASDATETARAEAAETTLTTDIAAETTRAEAAEATLSDSFMYVYEHGLFLFQYQISADVASGQVVSLDALSSDVVSPCTSTRVPLGVAQQDGLSGSQIWVCIGGVSPVNAVMAGAALRSGDILAVNDLAQVILAVPAPGETIRTIGIAVDADDGPLDAFVVYVAPGSLTGDSVSALADAVTTSEAYTDSSIAAIPAAHNYSPDIATAVGTETTRAETAEAAITASIPTLPITEANVTGLVSDLAGKASTGSVTAAITTAEAFATAADTSAAIAEVIRANAAYDASGAAASAVATEVTNRNTAIAVETTNRIAADATTLASAKTYADADIATEVTNRNTAIGVETTNRTTADTTLQTNITAEASTRATADTTNATAISTETTRATTAEGLLAPKASPTFTGTVSGITAAMVGADAIGLAATEQTRALAAEALLAPKASPTITGTAAFTNITVSGTTSFAAASIAYAALSGTPVIPTSFAWNSESNATGNLSISNAGFTSTFNQTSPVAWTWANTTASTTTSALYSNGNSLTGWTNSGVTVDGAVGNPASSFSIASTKYAYINAGVVNGSTIQFDFYGTSLSTQIFAVDFGCNSSGNGPRMRLDMRGNVFLSGFAINASGAFPSDGGVATAAVSILTPSLSTWHRIHIALASDGLSASWYLDGVFQANGALAGGVLGGYLCFYSAGGAGIWIDNIAVYSATVNANSPVVALNGTVWNAPGNASATDSWTLQGIPGSGSTAPTLVIAHPLGAVSAPDMAIVSVPNLTAGSVNPSQILFSGDTVMYRPIAGTVVFGLPSLGSADNSAFLRFRGFFSAKTPGGSDWKIGTDAQSTHVLQIASDCAAVWSSTTAANGTADSGISRIGAASLAIGNGTAGDITGSLTLNTLIAQGAVRTPAVTGLANTFGAFQFQASNQFTSYSTTLPVLTLAPLSASTGNILTYLNAVAGSAIGGVDKAGNLLIGGTDTGLSRLGAGFVGVGNGTAGDWTGNLRMARTYISRANATTYDFVLDAANFPAISISNAFSFAWSSTTNANAAADTNLSRISTGVIGVGTGAQGSIAGSVQANGGFALSSSGAATQGMSGSGSSTLVRGTTVTLGNSSGAGIVVTGASLSAGTIIEATTLSPTSAATAGTTGQIAWDSGKIYVCTAGGAAGSATWKAATLTTV